MGNIPVLAIFALLVIGYASYTAFAAHRFGSRTQPANAVAAIAAIVLTVGRHLWREPLIVYVGGLALCAVAAWHFDNIGRADDSEF